MTLQGDPQATFAATLVDEWVRAGVTDAVVAPGSRSTPIVLALAADARIRLHVHLDERSGAFYAVGLGLAGGRPAVVATTSGTAAAELHPAVVEAHQAGVPLIACTADRPPELHHVGAPQTIEQRALFAGSLRWCFDPGVADPALAGSWRSIAARAVLEATASRAGPGPVHLNLPFREPLVAEPGTLPPGRPGSRPWHAAAAADGGAGEIGAALSGRRGVLVAGAGAGSPQAVHGLAARLGWPVLADPRSRCRARPGAVAAFDALLRSERFAAAGRPEVAVRLGRPPASRVLAQWLASSGADQVVVDPHGAWPDAERTASVVVDSDPTSFCRWSAPGATAVDGRWRAAWVEADRAAQEAIESVVGGHAEVTEPGVARALTGGLGPEVTLFVSSSMPIRDVEWYGHPASGHRVLANRGANGIDGVVSTALGVAAATTPQPTVALLGDLAFLHDSGGLLWAPRRGVDCTLVVLDNDGGGIFSFLPQRRLLAPADFEALLATPHGLDLPALAEAHGIPATRVRAADEVLPAVQRCVDGGGVRLVHVRTDREANVSLHDEINRAVAGAVAGCSP